MKNPKVKLSDVAARAGMSQATASRALRGLKVHKKYQGKAEAAAKDLGYVLNEAARSLRSVRTMTVGMVYHDLTSLLGMELLGAMTTGLDEIGYSLFISTAQGKNDQFDKLVHRFLQRRVDALVCVHANGEGPDLEGYAAANVPVMALITKAGGYSGLPMVMPTVSGASADCLKQLRDLGHRSIIVMAPGKGSRPVEEFIAAAKAKRMKVVHNEIDAATFDATAALKAWRASGDRATVILARVAEAAKLLEAAAALKIRIPKDVSLVAIRDRSAPPQALPMALSTIHIDPKPMGASAAAALKAWLVEGVALSGDRKIEVGSWLPRDSTGPAPD